MADDAGNARLARMRAAGIQMVAGVVVVDLVGLAVASFTHWTRTVNGRTTVGLIWLLATLAVLVPGLRAIRAARRS